MRICAGLLWDFYLYYFRQWQTGNGSKEDRTLGNQPMCKVEEEARYGKRRNECQCERGYIGEKTTCAAGILFIILATGTTRSSTTTSTSTGTTTPLTATSKCTGTNSLTRYILGVQQCFPTKTVQ